MAIDPNVLLRGVVPDAVGAARQGFELGDAIRNAPILREQRQQQLAAGTQKAQAGKLEQGKNEALAAFRLFGDTPITAENFEQAVNLAAEQGIQVDDSDRIASPENIAGFNQVIQAGGRLSQAGGRGGLASAKTVTYNDGSVLQALPSGETQVRNPAGEIVSGQARLDVLNKAQKSGITQAGLKAFTQAEQKEIGAAKGGEQVLEITTDIASQLFQLRKIF